MKIITSGFRYMDIDVYGGIIAYAELLQKLGQPAQAVSTGPMNESVTKTVRSWPVLIQTKYTADPDDTFTLIDISEPEYFESFVDLERIDAVIDHHPGRENYWQAKIGAGADIRPVGAACTQVYEHWKKAGRLSDMSETSARLLMCGILDNTLNFGAKISTQLDKDAYAELATLAHLPDDWPAQYFTECQEAIDQDPVAAVQNDFKIIEYPSRSDKLRVGQFAVWDATEVLTRSQKDLTAYFEAQAEAWFMNIISIGEGKSYFLCTNPALQQWLTDLLQITFDGSIAVADRLWLRKETIQASIDSAAQTA
jgi:inorganic pyrophosphatase